MEENFKNLKEEIGKMMEEKMKNLKERILINRKVKNYKWKKKSAGFRKFVAEQKANQILNKKEDKLHQEDQDL